MSSRFPTEKTGIILVYRVMVDASKRWQEVKMTPKVTTSGNNSGKKET